MKGIGVVIKLGGEVLLFAGNEVGGEEAFLVGFVAVAFLTDPGDISTVG
ncbi:hypothetical protein Barb7_02689 [Bacteroidales bacterium Barb7]|nr:hypothetical protein Barb7_02689 [Bacteroidales bacterium Barb7]